MQRCQGRQMEDFEGKEDCLWEASMTQSGKKETEDGS